MGNFWFLISSKSQTLKTHNFFKMFKPFYVIVLFATRMHMHIQCTSCLTWNALTTRIQCTSCECISCKCITTRIQCTSCECTSCKCIHEDMLYMPCHVSAHEVHTHVYMKCTLWHFVSHKMRLQFPYMKCTHTQSALHEVHFMPCKLLRTCCVHLHEMHFVRAFHAMHFVSSCLRV